MHRPLASDIARSSPFLGTPSGESGFTARSCPTLKSICEQLDIPSNQLADVFLLRIPLSHQNCTYAFVPQGFLQGLFGVYGMDLPTGFTKPKPAIRQNDTIPSTPDLSTISYVGEFLSAPLALFVSNPRTTADALDNGRGVSLHSTWSDHYAAPIQGWTAVETAFLRLDTWDTPSGHFPAYVNRTLPYRKDPEVGYDAAVCVLRYEPWIVEAYNASITSPSLVRIVGPGDGSTSLSPGGDIRGAPIANTGYLNTAGKFLAFIMAHENGVNAMMKDEGQKGYYVPSPIVGPIVPPHTIFLLTSTHSTGRISLQWHWTLGVHRTLLRPTRHYPRTDRRG